MAPMDQDQLKWDLVWMDDHNCCKICGALVSLAFCGVVMSEFGKWRLVGAMLKATINRWAALLECGDNIHPGAKQKPLHWCKGFYRISPTDHCLSWRQGLLVLKIFINREGLGCFDNLAIDPSLAVFADTFFEEVGFALQRNHLHEVKRIGAVVVFCIT